MKIRKIALFLLPLLLIAGCAENSGRETAVRVAKAELAEIEKKVEEKQTELKAARKEQGKLKSIVWDSEKVDRLELELGYLEQAKAKLIEKVAVAEAGLEDEPPKWTILSALGVGLLIVVGLSLVSEGGLFGDGAVGGFVLIGSLLIALFVWIF